MNRRCATCRTMVTIGPGVVVEVVTKPMVRIARDGTVSRSSAVALVACWCSACGEEALREQG